MKTWNFVGHAGRIPNPGDYVTLDFAGIAVILVRDRDGTPRAFANTCRHRGAAIVEGNGNCRAFKCPYHGWVYALDNNRSATQALAQGEHGFDVFTYTMQDAHGATSTATLTIDITGTNDAPVITSDEPMLLPKRSAIPRIRAVLTKR